MSFGAAIEAIEVEKQIKKLETNIHIATETWDFDKVLEYHKKKKLLCQRKEEILKILEEAKQKQLHIVDLFLK